MSRYAFHEAPLNGRQRILEEARRLLSPGGVLAVIDIATDYEPSESMLAGEPYGTSTCFQPIVTSRPSSSLSLLLLIML